MRPVLVLDFDGLIVDTEWPEYVAWREVCARYGVEMTEQTWVRAVGHVDAFDPKEWLQERASGRVIPWGSIDPARSTRRMKLQESEPALPGVVELMRSATDAGVPLGVASNSSTAWVDAGLERLGLRHMVRTIRGRDRVSAFKPDPAPYLAVLADLEGDASASVAFEDSSAGVASAKAAGLHVIAVPNRLTRHLDLSAADRVVDSVSDFDFRAWRAAACAY